MGRTLKDEAAVPAPGDLAAWKQEDYRLSERFADHLKHGERPSSPRAIRRYFDDSDAIHFFRKHEQRGVAAAYSSWGMLDYRPTKASQTRAEQLLAEGLPPAQAVLLQARMEAYPTLYRVVEHYRQKGAVDLEDVLLGGSVTIHDRVLSQHVQNGLFLAARAFPAGQYHFLEMVGPPLGIGQGMSAVDFLQDSGMVFTREGLKRDAHKFGWLWAWSDEWEANWRQPQLRNMEGHEMLFHTASFSVSDAAAVRKTLLGRRDIDYDENADELVWSRAAGKHTPHDTVTIARLAFVGDELVLTANSTERFAEAREWLTQLPGVTFLSVTTREALAASEDRPLDDRLSKPQSAELTPEMVAALQEKLRSYYMGWLDMPLPMLGGRTPRQTCQSLEGRERVAMLIRTIPEPMSPVPVSVPRQAMLQALGIATGQNMRAELAPSREVTSKVGRNERCPCGSGRKFKHCCGGR